MGLFSKKTTADLKERAELDLRKAERKLASVREAARKADAELQAVTEEEQYNASENVEKVLRGETAIAVIQDGLGVYQVYRDMAKACAVAVQRAEDEHAQAVEVLRQADLVDRTAKHAVTLRGLVDKVTAALALGDAFRAEYDEDPQHLTHADFPQLADFMRAWLVTADKFLNPPAPPAPDPSKVNLRFTKNFNGREESLTHKMILPYSAGEWASFDRAQADLLLALGVAEPHLAPEPAQEPGGAPVAPVEAA